MLVEIGLKSLALLVVVALLSVFVRKSPPATRHWVWVIGFVGLMVLPFLRVVLPAQQVAPPSFSVPIAIAPTPPIAVPVGPKASQESPPPVSRPAMPAVDWQRAAEWAWTLVAVALAVRLTILLTIAARLAKRATPIQQPMMLACLDAARRQVGLRRAPVLLASTAVDVPMTFGVLRPVILMPCSAQGWDTLRLDAVLLHECAHVRRNDWAFLVLAKAACAVYWFNPLVWWAERRLRAESEAASDDVVLLSGVSASRYAEDLLSLAEGLCSTSAAPGLAIVQAGTLQTRIKAILAKVQRGGFVSRKAATVLGVGGLTLVSAIACARFAAAEAPANDASGVVAVEGGAKVSVEAITDAGGGKPRSWNMLGESLPQAVTIDDNTSWFMNAQDSPKAGVERLVVLRTELQGDIGVQWALTPDGEKKPALPFGTGPYGMPYQSLKGGTFTVCRVGFGAGKSGTLHVWAPVEPWQTYATATLANTKVTSTTKSGFSPKVSTDDKFGQNNLVVSFALPPELKGREVTLELKMLDERMPGRHLVPSGGKSPVQISFPLTDPNSVAALELRSRRVGHTVVRNIPLEPKPGKVATPASSGLPKMKSFKNGVAKLKDGTRLEIVGLIDKQNLEAGGWSFDGKRSTGLSSKEFRLDEEFEIGPPLAADRRNLFISFKRTSQGKAPGQLWIYDPTGRALAEANSVSSFSDDKIAQEIRTLSPPEDLDSLGLIVRCSVGDYKLVSKKRIGQDKGVHTSYLEKSASEGGGHLRITFPKDLIKDAWDRDFTFVLRDGAGKPLDVRGWQGSLDGGYMETKLSKEDAAKVATIEFRARDIETVYFEKVALKPVP